MSELDDAIAGMRIRAPSERNRRLARLLAAANANDQAEGVLARPAGDRRSGSA